MAQLQAWQNFYLLTGGASATLVGLMFVAISLGSGLYTREPTPRLNTIVTPMSRTYIHFVYVLATAACVLVPTMTETVLGALLVLAGLASLGHLAGMVPSAREQYRKRRLDWSDVFWYLVIPAIGYVLYLDAGIGLLRTAEGMTPREYALDALAAATILLLVTAVRNAWDLVVWMVLGRPAPPQ